MSFLPKPVHGHIPIWVGGHTAPAFRRAAKYGDGLHAAFTPIEDLRRHWAAVHTECETIGRDPAELELSTRVYLDPDGRMEPSKSLQGSADQIAEAVAVWTEAGVSHLILEPVARGGAEGRLDLIRRFVADIRPLISGASAG